MTPTEFCYWLQGFFEVVQPKSLDCGQVFAIREALKETMSDKDKKDIKIKTEVKISPDPGKKRDSAYDLGQAMKKYRESIYDRPMGRGQKYC